ncbi:MAG: PQQ-binding-like beta-propeller repeat protein [Opitutales bacterium]|nr:PQQ-binding-like beta-propeller repeat protein [Opitutales bacterium]MDB2499792.1 PQQ-binding-like beta-propeller repeat protein [bacterium]MDG2170284.1 PQQ-binding-like beta-propeller repeat protein [Opitutales bacterium]
MVGGSISSINIETRTENWARVSGGDLPESVFEPVIGYDGIIYVPMLAGGLWAFDSVDGSTKWSFSQFTNDWPINGALVGHDGTVFFGTSKGEIYAINTSSTGLQDSHWPKQARNNGNTGYGPNDFFFYSPNSIEADNTFQWIDLNITSNKEWELSENIPWVFLSGQSGDGEGSVSIVVEENQSGTERVGTITVGGFEIPIRLSLEALIQEDD